MTPARTWLLNLDAEIEIEARSGYPGPLAAIKRRPELVQMLASLVPKSDVILEAPPEPGALSGQVAICWSPTPSATAMLEQAGATVVRPLALATLRRVLSRELCASLGLTLVGAAFVRDPDRALAQLRAPSPSGRWLARRSFGFAGKGRRVVAAPKPADEQFVVRAAAEGGVLIEPFVDRLLDVGLHGYVSADAIVVGEPVVNSVGDGGVFRKARRAVAGELARAEGAALLSELHAAGEALRRAGYSGPFGVDGFRYRMHEAEAFQPRCEINARYSMAWGLGMGDRRPDLE